MKIIRHNKTSGGYWSDRNKRSRSGQNKRSRSDQNKMRSPSGHNKRTPKWATPLAALLPLLVACSDRRNSSSSSSLRPEQAYLAASNSSPKAVPFLKTSGLHKKRSPEWPAQEDRESDCNKMMDPGVAKTRRGSRSGQNKERSPSGHSKKIPEWEWPQQPRPSRSKFS